MAQLYGRSSNEVKDLAEAFGFELPPDTLPPVMMAIGPFPFYGAITAPLVADTNFLEIEATALAPALELQRLDNQNLDIEILVSGIDLEIAKVTSAAEVEMDRTLLATLRNSVHLEIDESGNSRDMFIGGAVGTSNAFSAVAEDGNGSAVSVKDVGRVTRGTSFPYNFWFNPYSTPRISLKAGTAYDQDFNVYGKLYGVAFKFKSGVKITDGCRRALKSYGAKVNAKIRTMPWMQG